MYVNAAVCQLYVSVAVCQLYVSGNVSQWIVSVQLYVSVDICQCSCLSAVFQWSCMSVQLYVSTNGDYWDSMLGWDIGAKVSVWVVYQCKPVRGLWDNMVWTSVVMWQNRCGQVRNCIGLTWASVNTSRVVVQQWEGVDFLMFLFIKWCNWTLCGNTKIIWYGLVP